MNRRYIDHSADLTQISIASLRNELEERLLGAVARFQEQCGPGSTTAHNSLGKQSSNSTLYTGTPGNIVLYLKLQSFSPLFAVALEQSIDSALRGLRANPDPLCPPSFYFGAAGSFSLSAVHRRDPVLVQEVLSQESKLTHPMAQHDLLYGTPGYIYCLLYILKNWPECPLRQRLIEVVNSAAARLVSVAKGNVLRFAFPARNGMEYIGAAHGALGAVQMLLLAREFLTQDYSEIVRGTLDSVLETQGSCGNFPMVFGDTDYSVVHFCHGAAGAVSPLLLAYQAFNDTMYLRAAERAAQVVWDKGLLKKGRGLCHGCSGSAYTFLSLYRTTGAEHWLHRAVVFAHKALLDPACSAIFEDYDDPQRLRRGSPDMPFSLMEGEAGALCLWADVLRPESSWFPGFELVN